MQKPNLIILALLILAAACTPQSPGLPDDAWRAVVNDMDTPNMSLENAQSAPSPRELQETDQMWCVVANVTQEERDPLYGNYLVYRSGDGWKVTIAAEEQFLKVGCTNYRETSG